MRKRAFVWWELLRTGLWAVPLGMLPLSVLLFEGALWIDGLAPSEALLRRWWLYSGTGDDGRNLLSTLVTSLITMSSLVFSITVVTLSLAANQFGSRMVRMYMSDARTKLALGLFMTTIVYCLLALRAVHKDMPAAQVPHVTVTLGLVLALVCVLALLLFLHVVARSIVADDVIRRVAGELEHNIEQLPPLQPGRHGEALRQALPADSDAGAARLIAREEGYVQAIEHRALVDLAARHGLVLQLDFKAGAFVCRDGWLGTVHPAEAATPAVVDDILKTILIGEQRTPTQDIEFSVRHLVDIALRALSPGINDANTALVVVDRLRGALSRLMGRALPAGVYRDTGGAVRLMCKASSHAAVLDAALNQIRQAAATHPAVIIRLLDALARIGEHARLSGQHQGLLRHTEEVAAAGLREAKEPQDRADIQAALEAGRSRLARSPCGGREHVVPGAA